MFLALCCWVWMPHKGAFVDWLLLRKQWELTCEWGPKKWRFCHSSPQGRSIILGKRNWEQAPQDRSIFVPGTWEMASGATAVLQGSTGHIVQSGNTRKEWGPQKWHKEMCRSTGPAPSSQDHVHLISRVWGPLKIDRLWPRLPFLVTLSCFCFFSCLH